MASLVTRFLYSARRQRIRAVSGPVEWAGGPNALEK